MNSNTLCRMLSAAALALAALAIAPSSALAVTAPVANTVPFVAAAPLTPHTSWSGNPVTLKGTMTTDTPGDTFTYDWDPGDGGAHCSGTVTNMYVIGCQHTYNGTVGTVFNAKLTIKDTTANLTSQPASYYTSLNNPPPNLAIEVNNAIDNGLWFLHQHMHRTTANGLNYGDWHVCDNNHTDSCQVEGDSSITGDNCNAFEVSGFLQNNNPANPYSDDVSRCLNSVFNYMEKLTTASVTNKYGTFNPDQNGNGFAITTNEYSSISTFYKNSREYQSYINGMLMDAIVASGTPNQVVNVAAASPLHGLTGSGPGGAYTYKDAIQDLTDYYSYCQYPSGSTAGGWQYYCQYGSDNSFSQWAAIGIIAARRNFAAQVPSQVLQLNAGVWLPYSQDNTTGVFGYTSSSPLWGPYAVTPSGMVQDAMNGIGRGNPLWDKAETYIRDNFANPASNGPTGSMKDYYYGLYSFTKSMLLYDADGTGLNATPLQFLQSLDNPANTPIDWYAAQAPPRGTDQTDGVARTLVAAQGGDGSWYGHNYYYEQQYFETGWAIAMLNKTVFQQVPVACFTVNPTSVASGGPVTLDGGCSYDQNASNTIVTWEWDVSGTGGTNFTIAPGSPYCLTNSCSKVKYNFTAPGGAALPYNYPVRLRVIDNATPTPLTADVVNNVVIKFPPNPPSANAGGPYNFCPNQTTGGQYIYQPWYLDGTRSTNPDDGKTDGTPGAPPSMITSYAWDFSCGGKFTDASGAQPNVTGAFTAKMGTSFNVCLQVTNNNNLAFPSAALPAGQSSVASASVFVHLSSDVQCTHCVSSLGAHAKSSVPGVPGNIQLYWTDTNSPAFPIDHYNIYRSTSSTFSPFSEIAGANSNPSIPAVQVPATNGATLYFQDNSIVNGTTYYYRVAPATANDTETCNSNLTLQVKVSAGR